MKIRNGFVSNSSSSSFVVLTTKANVDNIINNASGEYREFLYAVAKNPKEITVHGVKLVDLSRVINDSYLDEWDSEYNKDCSNRKVGGWEHWLRLVDDIAKGGGYTADECCG